MTRVIFYYICVYMYLYEHIYSYIQTCLSDSMENIEQLKTLVEEIKSQGENYSRNDAITHMRKIAESATLGHSDSTAIDFPNAFGASWYAMVLETLGRAFLEQVSEWDKELMYTENTEQEIFWLKYARKILLERIKEKEVKK